MTAPMANATPPRSKTVKRALNVLLDVVLAVLTNPVGRIVIVVVALVSVYLVFFAKSDVGRSSAGDCVSVTGTIAQLDAKRLDCTDPAALFVVAAIVTGGGSCDPGEVEMTKDFGTKWCLFYNVKVDDCLWFNAYKATEKGACAFGSKRVSYVSADTYDKTLCPKGSTTAIVDRQRGRLLCLTDVT